MRRVQHQDPSPAVRSAIIAFLAEHSTLTLATINPRREPHAAPLFFAARDDGSLVFLSSPKCRHSSSIAANGRAAVTVYGETWSWNEIVGVQMEGTAAAIPFGPERDNAWESYRAKFTFVVEFEAVVSQSVFYRFSPRWVRLIDNRVRFGHREEFRWSTEAANNSYRTNTSRRMSARPDAARCAK